MDNDIINIIGELNNRYSRFKLISWWNQEILSKAKILVVGCGALGNEIVKNLAMLGVGNIYVVDMDNVEKSNLTRSVLFRKEDEGKPKAETVCKRAKEINDEINIKYFKGNIFELGLGVFKEMDLVICGLDSREARLFVNQSCRKVNKVWIDGAIEVLSGVARMFTPDSPCYECTLNETDYKLINKRKSCLMLGYDDIQDGKIPTTPTISSIVAGVQVQEAIKFLHKNDFELLKGKGFVYNGSTNESYIVEYQEKENCPSHYTFDGILKINKFFSEATINNVLDFGKKYFGTDGFLIELNNETVIELIDEHGNPENYFANMNLISLKDIKRNEKLMKMHSVHKLNYAQADKFTEMKLTDLKIPYNDIITLKNSTKEIHIEFEYEDIFL